MQTPTMRCEACGGRDDYCNCGCDDIPYEIAHGAHYEWCAYYKGCHWCGSRPLWPWRKQFWQQWWWATVPVRFIEWWDKRPEGVE